MQAFKSQGKDKQLIKGPKFKLLPYVFQRSRFIGLKLLELWKHYTFTLHTKNGWSFT